MKEKVCGSCAHYLRHYALDSRKIFRVYCGHCTFERPRSKMPDAAACDNYVRGECDEAAFVSKEFLSKELLRYMMQLELLPKIKDAEE